MVSFLAESLFRNCFLIRSFNCGFDPGNVVRLLKS